MADNDDWRAQRAADLAGTPFARPTPSPARATGIGDATLPIGRPLGRPPIGVAGFEPRANPPAATAGAAAVQSGPAGHSNSTLGWIAGAVVALACLAGLFFALRPPQSTPVVLTSPSAPVALPATRVVPPAPVAPSPSAPVPSASVSSVPPLVITPATRAEVQPSSSVVDDELSSKSKAPAAKSHRKAAHVVAAAAPAKKRASGGHKPAVRHPAKVKSADTATYDTGRVASYVPYSTAPALPICQPGDYTRAPRPCRPSHNRVVRKPFFQN